jgi:hypothetical protein
MMAEEYCMRTEGSVDEVGRPTASYDVIYGRHAVPKVTTAWKAVCSRIQRIEGNESVPELHVGSRSGPDHRIYAFLRASQSL